MLIDLENKKLAKALTDFSNAIGTNITLTDENFNFLNIKNNTHNRYCSYIQSTEKGYQKCVRSDIDLLIKCRQTRTEQYHICHAGLIDIGVPLIHNDVIIGYLILGQLKKSVEFPESLPDLKELAIETNTLEKYYDSLMIYEENKMASIINIAVMLAKYIIFEKMLYPVTNDCIEKATIYISHNLAEDLSIKSISKATGYSQSELYKSFHKFYHCTVGDYINKNRIEYSTALLLESGLSIEEISRKTGFSSAPYFSKKFKEIMGVSPLKFKKSTSHS